MLDQSTALVRLGISFGLGFALGFERELRGQSAGLRTHILVCLGSCLFTLCSLFAEQPLDASTPAEVRADITRIASQVVVGIGFLGGGAILRHGASIRGLTTAANLWLTASVGLAVGFGLPVLAVATTGLALFALAGLRFFESAIRRIRKKYQLVADHDVASHETPKAGEDSVEPRS
ncbi:MgtC/SapB family protein [Archangium lansingense]|uniref:MgtC/SapB family protein n=1 Tax=Archangium lansingense TaxID=2995310 RepID=A0ABT4ALJ7_9BACT|nr:MgtC/SapB family protein [Archangium lansinium]MCY1082039.1 MgtC/SapB family protein [Archangium lansinium]